MVTRDDDLTTEILGSDDDHGTALDHMIMRAVGLNTSDSQTSSLLLESV